MSTAKILPAADVFYQGADGNHVHLPADIPAAVPADSALDLCVTHSRAKYMDAADVPKEQARHVGRLVATAQQIAAAAARAKWRREHAAKQA